MQVRQQLVSARTKVFAGTNPATSITIHETANVSVGALVLAEAQVAAGATGTAHASVVITQVARHVVTRGSTWPVTSDDDRDALALLVPPTAEAPLTVEHTAGAKSGQLERNAGSDWVVIAPMMQKGNVLPTGSVAAGGIGALTPVVFPVPFPSAPEVILQDRGARLNFFNVTATATGFSAATLNVSSEASNAASIVRWIALL